MRVYNLNKILKTLFFKKLSEDLKLHKKEIIELLSKNKEETT